MVDWKSNIEKLKRHELIPERDIRELCEKVKELFIKEANILNLSPPIHIVGDIHGQFHDLLNVFRIAEGRELVDSIKRQYLFLGDYVDRGHYSIETLMLLMLLKVQHPDRIFLIRGNHEVRQISLVYGFYEECNKKYGNMNIWRFFCDMFDYLPLAAIVSNGSRSIFCVHGGLSPELNGVDQIQILNRRHEVPNEGPFADLLWSDPEETLHEFRKNPRGCGYLFSAKATDLFNYWNDFELLCRAHQLARKGFQFFFPHNNCVIVWSAPNYCYREQNLATVLLIDQSMNRSFTEFAQTPEI